MIEILTYCNHYYYVFQSFTAFYSISLYIKHSSVKFETVILQHKYL